MGIQDVKVCKHNKMISGPQIVPTGLPWELEQGNDKNNVLRMQSQLFPINHMMGMGRIALHI